MGSKKTKVEQPSYSMDVYRPFGANSSQTSVNTRSNLNPELFMKIGTRVGVITVYYEHIVNKTLSSRVPPVTDKEAHIYDVPKNK